jgi:hypothetical protein
MLAIMQLPVLEHREVKLPKGLQSNINDVFKPFISLKYKFPVHYSFVAADTDDQEN